MNKNLESYLESFGVLSQNDRNVLGSVISTERFERGVYLWRAGQACENLFFVSDGVVRLFFFDEKGDEITVHFVNEQNFIVIPGSFGASEPLPISALVETGSEIVVFDKTAQRKLEVELSDWSALLGRITEKTLFDKVKFRNRLFQATAKERFEIFLSSFPGVANRTRAADVASFLGISQYTLSHLKKGLVSNI